MPGDGADDYEAAQAAGSGGGPNLPTSALPWHQIPKFEPGITDVRNYAKKLEFIRDLWPAEHIEHLAPRAALQVEGVAFQKVARLQPEKLRNRDGVKYLVEALGGQWGRLEEEDRYDLFEKALYATQQKTDETHDSYLNRHDIAFEDLVTKKVQIEEIRAYVLIRQSALNAEDRKKIIMDCGGKLRYEDARRSMKLLGSKFFQELQGPGRNSNRTKTYDIHQTEEVEESPTYVAMEQEPDEELVYQALLEEGDEDAHFVQDFEEQVLVTCQDSPELASCFTTYQEARDRLKEKARTRGFWPLKPGMGFKGKGRNGGKKGKGYGGPSNGSMGTAAFKRRSLAERIANSTCRKCGQPGHWRRECPQNTNDKEKTVFTGLASDELGQGHHDDVDDVMMTLPEDAVVFAQDGNIRVWMENQLFKEQLFKGEMVNNQPESRVSQLSCPQPTMTCHVEDCLMVDVSKFSIQLAANLSNCCRKHRKPSVPAAATVRSKSDVTANKTGFGAVSKMENCFSDETCLFNSEEAHGEAIIDTGASRAVIGENRVRGLLESFPKTLRDMVYRARTPGVTFKFGNASKLTSTYALLLPRGENGWIRLEVVPGNTPCLVSNSILKGLRGIVDVEDKKLRFKGHPHEIILHTCRRNLLGIKVVDLLLQSPPSKGSTYGEETIMHVVKESCNDPKRPDHPICVNENTQQGKTCRKREGTQGGQVNGDENQKEPDLDHALKVHDRTISEGEILKVQETAPTPKQKVTHDRSSRKAISFQRAAAAGGSDTTVSKSVHDIRGDYETTWSTDFGRVGRSESTIRETSREDLCGDLQPGPKLCLPAEEPSRCIRLGTQFPNVYKSPTRGQQQDPGEGASDACPSSQDIYGQDVREPGDGGLDLSSGREPVRCIGIEQAGAQTTCRRRTGADDRGTGSTSSHGAQDTDRHPAARTRTADSRVQGDREDVDRAVAMILSDQPLKCLSSQEEQTILMSLEMKSREIQDELEVLPMIYGQNWDGQKGNTRSKFGSQNQQVDLLEIYCEPNSQLVQQVNSKGGRAIRFSRTDGDLSTKEGVQRLWTWIHMYEPRHIWVAPECRLWGRFSRFNMGRCPKMFDKIQKERNSDRCHLTLCNDLYMHQVSMGHHFHLEQPQGSEMLDQPELVDTKLGTLPATFDMCRIGKLKLPKHENLIRKRTQVFSTSRKMFEALHDHFCKGDHEHDHIQGKTKVFGEWVNVSSFARAYTVQFARKIAQIICDVGNPEKPLMVEEMILGLEQHERPEMASEALQLQKRHRVYDKQPETSLYDRAPTWGAVFRTVGYRTPRVGNVYFGADELVTRLVQRLVPELENCRCR